MLDFKNKKVIIAVVVVVVLLLALGVAGYQSLYNQNTNTESPQNRDQPVAPENSQDTKPEESPTGDAPDIQINQGAQGGLTICSDKCGDGVCQPEAEIKCDGPNCVCKENKQECSQDCK